MHDTDPATTVLHADRLLAELPDVAPAIRPATTFERTTGPGRTYRRDSHETTERFEAVIAALEGGEAVAYPSGMGAIAAVLRELRPQRISLPDDVYHGTRSFVDAEAERGSWQVVSVDELGPGDVRWIETPSNPKCLITDLAAAAARATAVGVVTVVDSTFATPILQQPLRTGCDVVVHASTKFIGGHSDTMGGVAVTSDATLAAALRSQRIRDGALPGALDIWLALRGVRTLPLRVGRQSASALEVARFLHGRVPQVWYPGLDDHPGHDVAKRQMSAFGGIVSFELETSARALAAEGRLAVFRQATSLGGVESLAEYRRRTDPAAPPGLIRLSIGLEAPADLITDLGAAIA